MGYSGARGTLIYEKNLKAKILCQTPFNRKECKFSNQTNLQYTVAVYRSRQKSGQRLLRFLEGA